LDEDMPVILVTGHGDIPMAVKAIQDGVYDFITKPFAADRLIQSVRRAAEKRRLVLENRALRKATEQVRDDLPLIGQTPAMERLRHTLRQIADTDVDVLVTGETGSGKEVVASLLHQWSRRASGNFVALNCGALPETVIESELFGHEPGAFTGAQKKRIGRIEHASGGTLFLDEIESMPPSTQVQMLRVLEMREVTPLGTNEVRPVDLRVVAAAKVDLGDPRQRGEFPRGSLLPAQCGDDLHPAAARAARRYPVAFRLLRRARRQAVPARHAGLRQPRYTGICMRHRLAGQCSRAVALCRALRAWCRTGCRASALNHESRRS
jgi:two-component system C4-dicarboxylate transport response regulator DctD